MGRRELYYYSSGPLFRHDNTQLASAMSMQQQRLKSMTPELRSNINLYLMLLLVGIGLVFVYLGVTIYNSSGNLFPSLVVVPFGLFLIIYNTRLFLRFRLVLSNRRKASESGHPLSCTVVDKTVSTFGRRPYWSLTAKGMLSNKETVFTDPFLLHHTIDELDEGSTVVVRVVTDNPEYFEFQLDQ